MKPRALILDLDGTLVDSDTAYAEGLKAIGIDPDSPDFFAARQRVKSRLGPGHVSARNRMLYFKEMLVHDRKYSHSQLIKWMTGYEQAMIRHLKDQWIRLHRDALFTELTARLSIVLLTNETLRMQTLKLEALDPQGRWFSRVLTSEEVGTEKPEKKGFELALKWLGVVPAECVMVGDSWEHDMLPAKALGISPILTTEFLRNTPAMSFACRTISKLDELRGLL